jgi:hypothetical protein
MGIVVQGPEPVEHRGTDDATDRDREAVARVGPHRDDRLAAVSRADHLGEGLEGGFTPQPRLEQGIDTHRLR